MHPLIKSLASHFSSLPECNEGSLSFAAEVFAPLRAIDKKLETESQCFASGGQLPGSGNCLLRYSSM